MFGICGIVGKQHSQLFNSFKKTLEFAKCDSFEKYTFRGCSLGIAGNKEAGRPGTSDGIFSLNGKSVIILGSIINKLEMGYSDNISSGEIVLDLYQSTRLSNLKNANGSFLFVIWDDISKKLLIGSDRHGTRRLFYRLTDDHLSFSTKISGFLKAAPYSCEIDKDSMLDLMVFGYILGNRTLLHNVRRLSYASILEFDGNRVVLSRYWDWHFDESLHGVDEEQLQEEMIRLICQAVRRNLYDTDNLLLPLSGGLDSRAILGACIESSAQDKMTAFTYGERGSYDLEIGTNVAHAVGVRHLALLPDRQDFTQQFNVEAENVDNMIEATPFYPVIQYRELHRNYSSIFSGQAGGSLFDAKSPEVFSELDAVKDQLQRGRICMRHHALHDFTLSKRILGSCIDEAIFFRRSGFDQIPTDTPDQCIRFMKYWACSQRLFNYTPFCNCRFQSVFVYLNPFLDKDLVDFALKIPQELLVQQHLYRKALLSWQPDLFALPTSRRSGLSLKKSDLSYYLRRAKIKSLQRIDALSTILLKKNFTSCKTKKYVDYDNLLRTNLNFRNAIRELLNEVKSRNLCDKEYLEHLWDLHLNGKANFYRVFSVLLTFEVSLKTIVD